MSTAATGSAEPGGNDQLVGPVRIPRPGERQERHGRERTGPNDEQPAGDDQEHPSAGKVDHGLRE